MMKLQKWGWIWEELQYNGFGWPSALMVVSAYLTRLERTWNHGEDTGEGDSVKIEISTFLLIFKSVSS